MYFTPAGAQTGAAFRAMARADAAALGPYRRNSKAARKHLALARPSWGSNPAWHAALEAARARGACAYTSAPLRAGEALQVDHCADIATVEALMWESSCAHSRAKGHHLPWPPAAVAYVAGLVHSASNLRAVSVAAHAEKTALGTGYVKLIAHSMKRVRGVPRAGIPLVSHYYWERMRARENRGARARLRADFHLLQAEHHATLARRLQLHLSSLPAAPGDYSRMLVQWLAQALGSSAEACLGRVRELPEADAGEALSGGYEEEEEEEEEEGDGE
jgi:hypothetical protein